MLKCHRADWRDVASRHLNPESFRRILQYFSREKNFGENRKGPRKGCEYDKAQCYQHRA